MINGISVLMPTFNQAYFIRRAISSLERQSFSDWELIIINDGCTDETEEFIDDFLTNLKIRYIKNESNMGMGYSLNRGLSEAKFEHIAYLPSDDYYYENHLDSLKSKFEDSEDAALVFSGVRYGANDTMVLSTDSESTTIKRGHSLQLIQTLHRKTSDKWIERHEFVTEDLFIMFWNKLLCELTVEKSKTPIKTGVKAWLIH